VLANQRSRLIAATIELVADRGYDGTKVSNIVQLAGVSKASFYEQFAGKDECFTAACDTALRAAASAVLRGESRGGEGRDRIRAGLTALAELMAAQPKATRLVLIDAVASTPAIREHLRERFGLFEALVHDRLASTGHAKLPRHLIAGLVRGIAHHARRCVGAGRPERFRDLVDPLLDWGLGFNSEEASAAWQAPLTSLPSAVAVERDHPGHDGARAPTNTRDLLMAAALRLASQEGFAALTPSRIRSIAGVSRRSFDANFDDVAGCFLAAVEAELDALFTESLRQERTEASWVERTEVGLGRFASALADAPDLARLAFVEALEAAPASLLWREQLITAWTEAIYRGAPTGSRPAPAAAEAAVAAVWEFVADLIAAHRLHLLPGQARRLTFLVLTPTLRPGRADVDTTVRATEVHGGSNAVFSLSTASTPRI
jgi:AcrR family transcriptional regulator